MKKLTLLLLLLIPSILIAQDITVSEYGLPIKDGLVVYENISEVPGYKKEDIYAASKKWIADNFTSTKNVIQTEDKETGQIIGKGSTYTKISDKNKFYTIEFNVQVTCKDDKYRIRFYQMNVVSVASGIISVDLVKTNSPLPLEICAFAPKDKTFNTKEVKKIKEVNEYINNHFTALLASFNSTVKRSSQDTF